MLSIELLINVLARGVLGLLSAIVLGMGFWWLAWVSINTSDLSLDMFFFVQAVILGGPAAAGTILIWWNTQSSGRVRLLVAVAILVTAVASAWLVNEIRGVETHYALVQGVLRVKVFSIRHMLESLVSGAVLGGNAMAATLYVYRALRHHEV